MKFFEVVQMTRGRHWLWIGFVSPSLLLVQMRLACIAFGDDFEITSIFARREDPASSARTSILLFNGHEFRDAPGSMTTEI